MKCRWGWEISGYTPLLLVCVLLEGLQNKVSFPRQKISHFSVRISHFSVRCSIRCLYTLHNVLSLCHLSKKSMMAKCL